MDSHGSVPAHEEQTAKKPYSTPQLVDLGAIGQLSLGGSGIIRENMPGGPNRMKHP
jgi:hypothetical protein